MALSPILRLDDNVSASLLKDITDEALGLLNYT